MNEFRRDLIRIDFFPMLFAAGEGFVCIAPEPRSEPMLLLFHADGSVMDTLMTAVLPDRDDTAHLKFHISRHGILAVPDDPESYYCVYLINLLE
ncbi:MAG: hypothetical protein KAT09_04015 [Candidatus Aegiribacteria sp.]|nr:hypothetical protein [Candidatus Aegiribacteria sp.]